MPAPPPNYRRAFWKSRQHAWLGILTLGLGFLTGEPFGLLVGGTLYALGLVFVPDFAFFRRAIDARERAAEDSATAAELATFQQEQEKLLDEISGARRTRYNQLVAVCRDIESATAATAELNDSTRRAKLDELAWTYLRMLAVEQSLEVYLETERKEQVPGAVRLLESETQELAAQLEVMKKLTPPPATLDGRERLFTSRVERLASLKQRLVRIEQAETNHDLMRSEQQRLVEQVKLIRADAIASRNTDTLISRLDFNIEHLAATNKWLSEVAEFKDLATQLPAGASASPAAAPPRKNPVAQSTPTKT